MTRQHGRHRKVAPRRTASPPLLAASGTMAVAALTAVVLSGQDSPDVSADPPSDGSRSSFAEPRDPGLLADPLLLAGLSLDRPGALGSSRVAAGLDGPVATVLSQAVAAAQTAAQAGASGSVLPLPAARPVGGLPGAGLPPVVTGATPGAVVPRTPAVDADAVAAGPVSGVVPPVTQPVADVVAPITKPLPEQVTPITTPARDVVPPVLGPITRPVPDVVAPIAEPATDVVPPVLGPITRPVPDVVAPIAEPATDVVPPVVDAVAPVVTPVAEAVTPVVEPVTQVVAPVTEAVAPVVAPVREAAAPVVEPVREAAAPVVEPVREAAAPVLEPVTDLVEPSDDELASSLEHVGQLAGLVP